MKTQNIDTEHELFILDQQIPDKARLALDVLRHIAREEQKDILWAVVGGFMYGIIWGKRMERARKKARKGGRRGESILRAETGEQTPR